MSSNPQPTCDVYVTVSREKVHRTSCHAGNMINVDLDANGVPVGVEILGALEYAIDGPRVTPQASSAERSEEDLVSAIAESLRDFQVSAGGMLFTLTETERRRIGWTVRGVCQQVVRDE